MDDEKFHFRIPESNISSKKVEKTGGGKSFNRDDHASHGVKLRNDFVEAVSTQSNRKDFDLSSSLYLQIKIADDYSIKSEKVHLEQLGFEIINTSSNDSTIGVAKLHKAKIEDLNSRLDQYINTKNHTGKTYFSAIEDIKEVSIEQKIESDINLNSSDEIDVIFNLYSILSAKEKFAIIQSVTEEVRKYTNDFSEKTFSNGITSIACTIKPNVIPEIAYEFTTIKEIRLNYTTYVETSTQMSPFPDPLTVDTPKSNSVICIIDSGINANNTLFTPLVVESKAYLPSGSVKPGYSHGTFVASRCLFGDDIQACIATHTLTPYCRVLDVQVFGKDNDDNDIRPDEFHLRTVIDEVVKEYSQTVRVYNLSLGRTSPVQTGSYSDLAKLLDFLSKEYKVLFIVAAGNIRDLLGPYPIQHFQHNNARIGSPSESLLSLTVGSIAKYVDKNCLSNENQLSPFSKIGPGVDNGIKPELVAHGGNYMGVYSAAPRIATYGISGDCQSLSIDNGTSFSVPLISCYAQMLFDLYPNSNPNLIKALLCHFTEPRIVPSGITNDPNNYVGFGEPIVERAITAGDHNAAYIYEGQLDQDNYQYIGFHIPSSLAAENNDTKLKLKITITYDPPVSPDNVSEYSLSRISACIFKAGDEGMREVSISGDSTYSVPWNPIIKFEKAFTRSYLSGQWDIRLRLYTRGPVKANYRQDYSIVIEIIDSLGGTDVYNDILKEFGDLYRKIEIRIAA